MIIWIFLIWISLSIILLFLGFWTDDQIIQTIAFGILWIPAFVISGINAPLLADTPGIQYPIGDNISLSFNETYVYGWNYSGYHWDYGDGPEILPKEDPPVNLFHRYKTENTIHENIYETYSNRLYGILLIFVSVFGMVLSVGSMRGVNDYEGPQSINWRRFWK